MAPDGTLPARRTGSPSGTRVGVFQQSLQIQHPPLSSFLGSIHTYDAQVKNQETDFEKQDPYKARHRRPWFPVHKGYTPTFLSFPPSVIPARGNSAFLPH